MTLSGQGRAMLRHLRGSEPQSYDRLMDVFVWAHHPGSPKTIPLLAVFRDHLGEHNLRTGRVGDDLVFGRTALLPFGRPRSEPARSPRGSRRRWSR